MKNERLQQQVARIGEMSLRERLFVFVAVLVVLVASVQWLLTDPATLRARQARDRLLAAEDGLADIARRQAAQGSPANADHALRDRLAALEAKLGVLNADLEARQRALVSPERMPQMLREMVGGQSGLRVAGFRSLAPEPVVLDGPAGSASPALYRHGFEITVSGRYDALVAYLERLEALPWRLEWSEARLDATHRPELWLTLTVHTLSLEEAWLRV